MDVQESYKRCIEAVALTFAGMAMNERVVNNLTYALMAVQSKFLHDNPDYTRLEPLRVVVGPNYSLDVFCRVGTVAQAHAERLAAEENDRLLKEYIKQRIKRENNFRRVLNKLTKRCGYLIPQSTYAIWDSFSAGQQYAILKDIDYERRHGK